MKPRDPLVSFCQRHGYSRLAAKVKAAQIRDAYRRIQPVRSGAQRDKPKAASD